MRSYRGMPLRTKAMFMLVDAVRRKPIVEMDAKDIQQARDFVYPHSGPLSRLLGRVPDGVEFSEATATARDGHGIPLRVCAPTSAATARPLIVWFHGGGWVLGNVRNYDAICGDLAVGVDAVVVSVDYRMAPEHRAPTAALDCIDATRWIRDHAGDWGADGSRLAVAGDSAGGNLAAVVAQALRDEGDGPLRAQALVYPATDMTMASPSIAENANAAILTKSDMDGFREHYCPPGHDLRDPLVSPLFGRLDGLAPALVQTAQFDPIRDDGSRYAEAMTAAGSEATLTTYDGVPHGFIGVPGAHPAGARQRVELIDFLSGHLRPLRDGALP